MVTTEIEHALQAIKMMDPRSLYVDNELSPANRATNAMTLLSQQKPEALLYHGPHVSEN